MGKYTTLQDDVFSVFALPGWGDENIKTFPTDFVAVNAGTEYIRVNVIPNGGGINNESIAGILVIDIFVAAGLGPSRTNLIADKLDQFLQGKSLSTADGILTQFFSSSLAPIGKDRENPALWRSSYTIPFKSFGVM